jgi:hypothetical protein
MATTTYKNISSATTTTLLAKNTTAKGDISKITIANHDNSDEVIIKLYLYDGTNTYVITETTIPPLVTLVLDDNLRFKSGTYDLKIDTSTTAEITVIIK